jgi:hypothetical protein
MSKPVNAHTRRTAVRPVSRPAYGTPAWQARSKCTSLRIALMRARQLAAEDAGAAQALAVAATRTPFVPPFKTWSKAWTATAVQDAELRALRSARRVERMEAQLATATSESERLAA